MIYGAILAGGTGKRMGAHSLPKQFLALAGTPIIVLTLRAFLKNERFDKIFVAIHPDWHDYLSALLPAYLAQDELDRLQIVDGGKERIFSFINIMEAVIGQFGLNSEDILICHDSVRPFVTQQMINDCIDATLEDDFALTVVPTTDTIHVAHDPRFIDGTLDRNGLYNGQNPAGFNILLLKKAIDSFTENVKESVTGTTQLILKLGYRIRIVEGNTSNFKITTDNDLDVADRMMCARPKTRKVSLLDCTLRDGGIAVDFQFGAERMQSIKASLEASRVEYIECGYIDERKGYPADRTCFDNEQSIRKTLLSSGKKSGVTYLAMIDYGTFDVERLHPADPEGIDGIRLAFHKEKWRESIDWGKTILRKGYQLYVQPMVSLRYSDEEFRELISVVNRELPGASGFYIVDSFGQMDSMALLHKLEIADQAVLPGVKLGFHAHNNRQLAFSNACAFVQYPAEHDLMVDSSIMGMGKGAGNLCTELIIPILREQGKDYETAEIYDQISSYFSKQLTKTPWGYSLDYYLASQYGCTPSYIKLFEKDERVDTAILVDLLKNMPEEKKAACDKVFAARYLSDFFEHAEKE